MILDKIVCVCHTGHAPFAVISFALIGYKRVVERWGKIGVYFVSCHYTLKKGHHTVFYFIALLFVKVYFII